jgi:hypothetical protein
MPDDAPRAKMQLQRVNGDRGDTIERYVILMCDILHENNVYVFGNYCGEKKMAKNIICDKNRQKNTFFVYNMWFMFIFCIDVVSILAPNMKSIFEYFCLIPTLNS